MKIDLTDKELSMIGEVITNRMGLHFPQERWPMLGQNLAAAAKEFGYINVSEFIQWLLSAPLKKEQMEILSAYLTISETYFWREPQVFKVLTDNLLPELIKLKKNNGKRINIWSAGCSTGEEPYSIAIALHRTIPKINGWNIKIIATDINPKSLIKAKNGIYNPWSFRNSPSWLKSSYFHPHQDNKYEIIPEIRKMVTFSCFSLTEDSYLPAFWGAESMDIIFCRNVLMYFTNEWAGKISQNLFRSLSDGGWLIVSSCELSSQLFPELTSVNFPGAILYRKSKKKPLQSFNVHSLSSDSDGSGSFSNLKSEMLPATEKYTREGNQSFSILSDTSQHLSSDFAGHSSPARMNSKTDLTTHEYSKLAGKEDIHVLKQAHSHEKPYKDSITSLIHSIRLLADKGQPAEALSTCDEVLVSYKLVPELYLLRASILQELDRSHEAIRSVKQAIYIDQNFIMGHFTLGNLFFQLGNLKHAKQSFNNALELLNTRSDEDILPESEGLSVKHLREIILNNLQI